MIVPMEKVLLLGPATLQHDLLTELRNLGIVHLTPIQEPTGETLEKMRHQVRDIRHALGMLPKEKPGDASGLSGSEILSELNQSVARKRVLEERLEAVRREEKILTPLGEFDPAALRKLQQQGVEVHIYKQKKKLPLPDAGNIVIAPLQQDRADLYFAAVGGHLDNLKEVSLPASLRSRTQLDKEVASIEAGLEEQDRLLHQLAKDRHVLQRYADEIEENIAFAEAGKGMGSTHPVVYLQGFCPQDQLPMLEAAAARYGWGYRFSPPTGEDPAPTLIQNPRWVEVIKPVFSFMNILPGYHEMDISAIFLIFFSLFFGMIVGDAGYGILFLLLSLAARVKLPASTRSLTALMITMSLCTIIWGGLTGNYFGITPAALPAPLKHLQVAWLADENHLMALCFLIGAVHLTIAHGWNVIRLFPHSTCWAHVGWIATTWVMYFGARSMILGSNFPAVLWIVFSLGCTLIILFLTPPSRLRQEWFNHVVLPLNLVNNFVDVVSYVRLFAVGMATLAVASAFNEMALGLGFSSVQSGLAAALILFAGHVLNMTLALMGVLVHAIRLNALEFSGHLGLAWTGIPYRPFSQRLDTNDNAR